MGQSVMSQQPFVTQDEWVNEIAVTHDFLWAQISRDEVDDQKVVYADGPWTGLDIIAHLSTWDLETLRSLQAHGRGEQYKLSSPHEDEDQFNRHEVDLRRPLGAERIYDEWHELHRQMGEVVRNLTPGQFQSPMMLPWDEIATVAHLLSEILKHEKQHVDDIVRAAQA